ncbi:hypothetical protein LT85_4142 [Collimonas arenae]|uniref:Uncharacterized protein n=1 Tax=Collimonas arenae TaxID=279058 RepID=A0A0A1FHZ6_9BURK|nr:hypothetical protein LT85_4142 [Collimonas arenae]
MTEATNTVMRRKAGNWNVAWPSRLRPEHDWEDLESAEEDRVMK